MAIDPRQCPSVLILNPDQVVWLLSLDHPAHSVEATQYCSLSHSHDGPHVTLGQHSFNTQWWVRWTLHASEIIALPGCTVERFPGDEVVDDNMCLLFEGHPGAHLFGSTYEG